MERLENILTMLSKHKARTFIVASNIALSGASLYKTLEYASNSEIGKATFTGICSLITAYIAGYNTRRTDL